MDRIYKWSGLNPDTLCQDLAQILEEVNRQYVGKSIPAIIKIEDFQVQGHVVHEPLDGGAFVITASDTKGL